MKHFLRPLIILMMMLIRISALAQLNLFDWARQPIFSTNTTTATKASSANEAIVDKDGNVYFIGDFFSDSLKWGSSYLKNIRSTSGTQNVHCDFFVIKFDSLGNELWSKSFGGKSSDFGRSIDVDQFGNIYITGCFQSDTLKLDNIKLVNNCKLNGGVASWSGEWQKDFFIAKLNSSGAIIWAKNAQHFKSNTEASSITVDKNNEPIVCGYYSDTSITFGSITLHNSPISSTMSFLGYESFITKFDSAGNTIWARSFGGTRDEYQETDYCKNLVCTDNSNNIYFTMSFTSDSIKLDATTVYNCAYPFDNTPGRDLLLIKFNTNGSILWHQKSTTFTSDADEQSASLCVDANNNIILGGTYSSIGITFDTVTRYNGFSVQQCDLASFAFIYKFDSTGTALWGRSELKSKGYSSSVGVLPNNDIYFMGIFLDSVSLDGMSTLYNTNNSPYFFYRMNQHGAILSGQVHDHGVITIGKFTLKGENVYLYGNFHSLQYFNPFTLNNNGSLNRGIFIAKSNPTVPSYLTDTQTSENTFLYPNPANNELMISTKDRKIKSVEIYNALGQAVKHIRSDSGLVVVDCSQLITGHYLCFIRMENAIISNHLVVRH